MKIGIYTLPLNFNYGGILQAYALQTILERMGHESIIIDRELFPYRKIDWRSKQVYKNIIKKFILRRIEYIHLGKYLHDTYPISTQYTEPFIEKYIKRIVVDENVKERLPHFDALICGSDQIWRRRFHGNNRIKVYNSFLQFAENSNVKRLSYAASLGVEEWEYSKEETERVKELISKFNAISVRESSGVRLLKENLDIDSCHVLDPTLLLEANEYVDAFEINKVKKSDGDLLVYILDKAEYKQKIVEHLSCAFGIKAFVVNSQAENYTAKIRDRIQPPVEKWLRGFMDAKLVITDSFHACIFSILFKKPFYVIGNKNRGLARINSLLESLGLENRIVESISEIKSESIDYDVIYRKLEVLRTHSYDFLRNNL